MIGYASSQDNSGSCANIMITVFFTDDFAHTDFSCRKEIYHVSRKTGSINKIFPQDGAVFGLRYELLEKIATMLRIEEIKSSFAHVIAWRATGKLTAQLIKSAPLADVWLPTPVTNESCTSKCINITSMLFDHEPKPLETSIVCDMLNCLVLKCGIMISNPFFDCHNSVFCNADIIEHMSSAKNIKSEPISKPLFNGNLLSFVVDAKRDCLAKVISSFSDCMTNKLDIKAFISQLSIHTKELISRLLSLSEIFVLGENINSSQDIYYLTLYELHSAFAFSETRLTLKTMVRHSRERMRSLGKMNIPDTIYPDNI